MKGQIEQADAVTEDEIFNLFLEAVEAFPVAYREAGQEWLAQRDAAHRLVQEIQTNGISALLDGDPT